MPWFFTIPEFIKKRACRYLLQHYMGQFLEERISLDDLTVDLYNGTGSIHDVPLNADAINEVLQGTSAPVKVISGYISCVTVSVPWKALLKDNCKVEISGLSLCIAPEISSFTNEDFVSMTDSLFFSMSSSRQMAEEVIRGASSPGEVATDNSPGFEGMEALAKAIELVLSRVQITLTDSSVQISYKTPDQMQELFLKLNVNRIEFYDEMSRLESSVDAEEESDEPPQPADFTVKMLQLSGLTVELGNTLLRNVKVDQSLNDVLESSIEDPQSNTAPIATAGGQLTAKVRVKLNDAEPGPKLEVDVFLGSLHILLSPQQLGTLIEILNGMNNDSNSAPTFAKLRPGQNRPIPKHDMNTIESQLAKHQLKEQKLQSRLQRKQDLFDADPYDNSLTSHNPQVTDMMESMNSTSEKFYSLDLGNSCSASVVANMSHSVQMEDSFVSTASQLTSQDVAAFSRPTTRQDGRHIHERCVTGGDVENVSFHDGAGLAQLSQSPPSYGLKQTSPYRSGNDGGASPRTSPPMKRTRNTSSGSSSHSNSRMQSHSGSNLYKHCSDTQHDICKYTITFSGITCALLETDPVYTYSSSNSSSSPSPPLSSYGSSREGGTRGGGGGGYSSMDEGGLDPLKYFEAVSDLLRDGVNRRVQQSRQDELSQVLPNDHLLLWVSTVKTTLITEGPQVNLDLSVVSAELWEYLYRNQSKINHITKPVSISPVIQLSEDTSVSPQRPCLKMKLSVCHTEQSKKRSQKPGEVILTNLDLSLARARINADVTLLDRLQLLLHSPKRSRQTTSFKSSSLEMKHSLYMTSSNYQVIDFQRQALFNQAVATEPADRKEQRLNIRINCTALDISLRFPVPDLKETKRPPWYLPSLRNEVLFVSLVDVGVSTLLSSAALTGEGTYSMECSFHSAKAYLSSDGSASNRELFLSISSGAKDPYAHHGLLQAHHYGSDLDSASVRVVVQPPSDSVLEQGNKTGTAPTLVFEPDTFETDIDFTKSEPLPFSGKRSMFSTGRVVDKDANGPDVHSEELIMPGSPKEMLDFEQHASDLSQFSIVINLPSVCIHLPSKHFLETIYNRFATDLVLWQPASPAFVEKANAKSMLISCMDVLQPAATVEDRFQMCKSVLKEEDSDEETVDDVIPEMGVTGGRGNGRGSASSGVSTQLAISLTIERGRISMLTDIEEVNSMNTPESLSAEMDSTLFQSATYDERLLDLSPRSSHPPPLLLTHRDCGLAVADLTNLHLFSVSGYKGDSTHDYFCAQIQDFSLHHIGSVDSIGLPLYSCVEEEEEEGGDDVIEKLLPVFYRAKCSPTHKPHPHREAIKPMLAVAMEMKFDKERNSKVNKCAIALLHTTVQYHMSQPQHHCFKQLGDFLSIADEPVPGYDPPSFITELHVHLNNCGLTYKPLRLPLTLLLHMDTISLSTSVLTGSPVLVVRLVMDGTYLLLSNEQQTMSPIAASSEPVCVLEMEWFEMTFRLCNSDQFEGDYEKLFSRMPDVSVECSSNVVHLRTCVDSCTALRDILVYLATNGDLQPRGANDDGKPLRDYTSLGSEPSLLSKQNSHPGGSSDSPLTSLNGSECVDIGDLISEAMDDLPSPDVSASMNTAPSFTTSTTSSNSSNTTTSKKHRTNSGGDFAKTKQTSSKPRMEIHMESDKSLIMEFDSDSDDSDGGVRHHPAVRKSNGTKKRNGGLMSPPKKSGTCGGAESDEDFCFIDTPTSTRVAPGAKPVVKCLLEDKEPLEFVEDHFTIPDCRTDQLQRPKHFPEPIMQYTLKEMTLIWHIYGGRDFGPPAKDHSSPSSASSSPANSPYNTRRQQLKDASTHTSSGRARANGGGGLGGFGRGREKTKKVETKRGGSSEWKTAGGPGRDHSVLVELEFDKLRFQYETYPKTTEQSSRLVLLVNDVEMRDKLMLSHINKFLYQYTTEAMPRQSHANMVSLKLLFTRPELETQPSIEEAAIRLSILPIRLNMDQDTVLFIYNFFNQIGDSAAVVAPVNASNPEPRTMIRKDSKDSSSSGEDSSSFPTPQEVFIRSFVFHPDLPIRIDYESKGFHTEMGTLAGILLGLSHLNNSEVKLKALTYKKGLLGWDKLAEYTCTEWVQDIRGYQLPLILKGVGPMHHVTQLVYGVMDLVRLPYQQYQEDGRIMWGLQQGATAFTSSTGVAVVELTSRLLETVQSFAQMAYDMVSATERSSQALVHQHKPHEPLDFREGVANAYDVVYAGIEGTATDLYTAATKEHEERGVSGAMGGVLRQIPGTIVKPIILASEATRHVLGGVKNQFVPDAHKEASEKWK